MMFFRNPLSQTGTRTRARRRGTARSLVLLGALLGCAQDSSGTGDPQRSVGDPDAQAEAPLEDASAATCAAHAASIAAFVATHSACSTDSDCVIVGDCSHADFQAVATDAADEARALVLASPCRALDGPTYNAVCRANKCERVPSGEVCGQAPQSECPDGTVWQTPGASVGGASAFVAGCHTLCATIGDDSACAHGYTCQATWVHPCAAGPGDSGTCAGPTDVARTLCLPAPECEVELAVTFGSDRTVARVGEAGSTQLKLRLHNRTDRTLDLAFDVPCPGGPIVGGLGSFDVYGTCVAGRCPELVTHETLALEPRATHAVGGAVLRAAPSTCNQAGLPVGRHAVSFGLAALTGAKVCGPAPATLIVD